MALLQFGSVLWKAKTLRLPHVFENIGSSAAAVCVCNQLVWTIWSIWAGGCSIHVCVCLFVCMIVCVLQRHVFYSMLVVFLFLFSLYYLLFFFFFFSYWMRWWRRKCFSSAEGADLVRCMWVNRVRYANRFNSLSVSHLHFRFAFTCTH